MGRLFEWPDLVGGRVQVQCCDRHVDDLKIRRSIASVLASMRRQHAP
jgi:hypothetical protein